MSKKTKETKRDWEDPYVMSVGVVIVSLVLHICLAWINPRDIFTDCRGEKNLLKFHVNEERHLKEKLRDEIEIGKMWRTGWLYAVREHDAVCEVGFSWRPKVE